MGGAERGVWGMGRRRFLSGEEGSESEKGVNWLFVVVKAGLFLSLLLAGPLSCFGGSVCLHFSTLRSAASRLPIRLSSSVLFLFLFLSSGSRLRSRQGQYD